MAESNGGVGLWIAGIAGLVAIGTWLAIGETRIAPERSPEANSSSPMPTRAAAPASGVELEVQSTGSGVLRIGAHGRLTIDHDTLPTEGMLTLDLEIPDDARGSGDRAVKFISTDGRRTDTLASPLPGAGAGVRLEIDPSFLTRGRYMIEIETDGQGPLQIRRYVLELR